MHESLCEIKVAPAERSQLSQPQAGERRGEKDRTVQLGTGRLGTRTDLVHRQHIEVSRPPQRLALRARRRIPCKPVVPLSAPED